MKIGDTQNRVEQASADSKMGMAIKYCFKVVEELLNIEARKGQISTILRNTDFYTAIYVCAIETTLFIHNSVQPTFEEVLDSVKLSVFEFWKVIQLFIRHDVTMPNPIKFHFSELEIKVISYLAWKQGSPVIGIINEIEEREKIEQAEQIIKIENNVSAEDEEILKPVMNQKAITTKYQHIDVYYLISYFSEGFSNCQLKE